MHRGVVRTALTAVVTTVALLGGAVGAAPANASDGTGSSDARHNRLPAPTKVKAKPGNKKVKITWKAPDDERINGFEIVRYPGAEVIPVPIGTESLVDFGLTNGETYEYTVESVDASGYNHSEPVSTGPVTPAAKPTPVRVSATCKAGKLHVSWRAANGRGLAIKSYRVAKGHATKVKGPKARAATFKHVNRNKGVLVRVRAENARGLGAWSTTRCT